MGSYLDVRERGESRKTLSILKLGRAENSKNGDYGLIMSGREKRESEAWLWNTKF